ncbi:hypothetical protein N0V87_006495 [Didymella glomerata]|uniref:Uncharacterized protein n=1 Tax=Didymella glomerata TaxID=749621 RepID=A0A9W8WWF9_9PLEO|nr:hypothetical protein N0V87_006495 [Didymella glomerata]
MTDEIDAFKRARELKASVLQNVTLLRSAPTSFFSQLTTEDSEDTLIITLRTSGTSWGDIVARLNARRIAAKEAPTWTEAAVYSRFILANSATATPTKEVGFEPRDYAHLKNAGSGSEGATKAGKKRVKDFQNATELSANIRKPATIEGAKGELAEGETKVKDEVKTKAKGKSKGKDEDRRKGESEEEIVKMDEGMVEILMRAVAKVERNFWVFVADEVEREGGKYIEPKELEKVFHEI